MGKLSNRVFYINKQGRLFVQMRPRTEDMQMHSNIATAVAAGDRVVWCDRLKSGAIITGVVVATTQTGVILDDWTISAGE